MTKPCRAPTRDPPDSNLTAHLLRAVLIIWCQEVVECFDTFLVMKGTDILGCLCYCYCCWSAAVAMVDAREATRYCFPAGCSSRRRKCTAIGGVHSLLVPVPYYITPKNKNTVIIIPVLFWPRPAPVPCIIIYPWARK
jgi:hypothetical protein